MKASALYDARQHATPSQLAASARRSARLTRIAEVGNVDAAPVRIIQPVITPVEVLSETEAHTRRGGSPLETRFRFSNFVAGQCNMVAHSAARQVCSDGIALFNPLFLCGSTGLGKSHLLQAIVWDRIENGLRATYVTAAQCIGVSAGREFTGNQLFAIDDLQVLVVRGGAQAFSNVLTRMLDAGCQVVLASDRLPTESAGFDDRITSRMSGGLVLQLSRPSLEVRTGIVFNRQAALKDRFPDTEIPHVVLNHLAEVISGNARQLEAAVNRLAVCAKFGTVTIEAADQQIQDLLADTGRTKIKVSTIQRICAAHYGVAQQDLNSARRTAVVVKPRQIAMTLAKRLTLKSLPEIGRLFGNRDHTTVLHAVRKMEGRMARDKAFEEEVHRLAVRIKEATI